MSRAQCLDQKKVFVFGVKSRVMGEVVGGKISKIGRYGNWEVLSRRVSGFIFLVDGARKLGKPTFLFFFFNSNLSMLLTQPNLNCHFCPWINDV